MLARTSGIQRAVKCVLLRSSRRTYFPAIRVVENQINSHDTEDSSIDVDALLGRLKQKLQHQSELSALVEKLKSEKETDVQQLTNLQNQQTEMSKLANNLRVEKESVTSQLAKLQSEMLSLVAAKNQLSDEMADLEGVKSEIDRQLDDERQEKDELQISLNKAREGLLAFTEQMEQMQLDEIARTKEIATLLTKVQDNEAQLKNLQELKEEEVAKLEKVQKEKEEEIVNLRESVEKQTANLEQSRTRIDQLILVEANLREALQIQQSNVVKKEADIAKLQKDKLRIESSWAEEMARLKDTQIEREKEIATKQEKMQRDSETLEMDFKSQSNLIVVKAHQVAQLQSELKQVKQEGERDVKEVLDRMKALKEESQTIMKEKDQKLRDLESTIEQHQEDLKTYNKKSAAFAKELTYTIDRKTMVEEEHKKAVADNNRQFAEIERLKEEIQKKQEEVVTLNTEKLNLVDKIKEKEVEVADWVKSTDEKFSIIAEWKQKTRDQKARADKLEIKAKELEEYYNSGMHEGVRRRIENLENDKKSLEVKFQETKKELEKREAADAEEDKEEEGGLSRWFRGKKNKYEKKITELTQEIERMKEENRKLTQKAEQNEEEKVVKDVMGDMERETKNMEEREKGLKVALEQYKKIVMEHKDVVESHLGLLGSQDNIIDKWSGVVKDTQDSTSVNLNIGGTVFNVKRSMLTKYSNSLLYSLLSKPATKKTDEYTIERDPAMFARVLEFLKTGKPVVECESELEDKIKEEFEYYGLGFAYRVPTIFTFSTSDDMATDFSVAIAAVFGTRKCTIIAQRDENGYLEFKFEPEHVCPFYDVSIEVHRSGDIRGNVFYEAKRVTLDEIKFPKEIQFSDYYELDVSISFEPVV